MLFSLSASTSIGSLSASLFSSFLCTRLSEFYLWLFKFCFVDEFSYAHGSQLPPICSDTQLPYLQAPIVWLTSLGQSKIKFTTYPTLRPVAFSGSLFRLIPPLGTQSPKCQFWGHSRFLHFSASQV